MKVSRLELEGLLLIELKIFGDSRGFFVERFNQAEFTDNGITAHFVQDNHSRSGPGVLRGMHCQLNPAQGKLVGVTRGKVLDVVVDIRPASLTFGKHVSIELTDMNGRLLWIPGGFAHGFCVLGNESVDILYKVDEFYDTQREAGFHFADPGVGIRWPIESPTISARDSALPSFSDFMAASRKSP